ncbi:MAG: beta-lactamase family protein, partial [Anaerolineales bacterium]|nr:beta-lactamase family protein [Anaerolineales bacterium]
FRVASITKLFTATAIMQLRDQGKLNLHDAIQQHLPWFNMTEAFPEEPPITILNLLTHTAGLPREPLFDHWL